MIRKPYIWKWDSKAKNALAPRALITSNEKQSETDTFNSENNNIQPPVPDDTQNKDENANMGDNGFSQSPDIRSQKNGK